MKPSEFMDSIMSNAKTTASWTFWDIKAPTPEDIEDSEIPILNVGAEASSKVAESASEAPEGEHKGVCLACMFNALLESNENMQSEIYDLKSQIDFLIKAIGCK